MTSVGTPIYVAPEVMAGGHYDATADSYSFGICLVAMIRGEKDVQEFYFQALRKHMKRETKKGVGITILNNRMYSQGWRPLLPLDFERNYPKMCKLIKRCWSQKKEERPGFDEIVRVMQGEVHDEVRRREEPEIVVYSLEADLLYHERMGKDEVFEEEEGESTLDTTKFVNKTEHERLMTELQARIRELEAGKKEEVEAIEESVDDKKKDRSDEDKKVDKSDENELAVLFGSIHGKVDEDKKKKMKNEEGDEAELAALMGSMGRTGGKRMK